MCYFLSTHPRASIGAQALINKLKFAYGAFSGHHFVARRQKAQFLPAASTDIRKGFEDDRRFARARTAQR
jgi:hypothetical protein